MTLKQCNPRPNSGSSGRKKCATNRRRDGKALVPFYLSINSNFFYLCRDFFNNAIILIGRKSDEIKIQKYVQYVSTNMYARQLR